VNGHNAFIKPNQLAFDCVDSERNRGGGNRGFEAVTAMLGCDSLASGRELATFLKQFCRHRQFLIGPLEPENGDIQVLQKPGSCLHKTQRETPEELQIS
jgi:hypothetical protein